MKDSYNNKGEDGIFIIDNDFSQLTGMSSLPHVFLPNGCLEALIIVFSPSTLEVA